MPDSITSSAEGTLKRILIACIGNIFLGDDGFGVEVAQRLMRRQDKQFPEGVQVIDFGIRGMDLAYTLLDDYETLVLV
nr:hydrogenase maturation protease [Ktedonobacteraceae bacterium]